MIYILLQKLSKYISTWKLEHIHSHSIEPIKFGNYYTTT